MGRRRESKEAAASARGSGYNLRTFESTVNDDVWGTASDPWVPTIAHEDHAQDIRYCYKEVR